MDATITEVQPSRGRVGAEETREPARRRNPEPHERRERAPSPDDDVTWPALPRPASSTGRAPATPAAAASSTGRAPAPPSASPVATTAASSTGRAPAPPSASPVAATAASSVAVRTTRGREIVVPAPVAAVGIASLLLALLLSVFDPPSMQGAALERRAGELTRWELAMRGRTEKALAKLESEVRQLRRLALERGAVPQPAGPCEGDPQDHLLVHAAEVSVLAAAIAALAPPPPDRDILPFRAPIDLTTSWVVSDDGRALGGIHMSSGKGRRSDPFTGAWKDHHGLDLSAPVGTPVIAPGSGTVVFAGSIDPNVDHGRALLGIHVLVEHATGKKGESVTTLFAHLDKASVRAGQKVRPGDTIGAVGNTGRSTAPHLHYQVMRGEGASRVNLDPLLFITDAILVQDGRSVWYAPALPEDR